jgi:hypothetical protein
MIDKKIILLTGPTFPALGPVMADYLGYGLALVRGMCHSDLQYSAASVREVKYTRLGYRTRLSRLHTLDPPLALTFLRNSHPATSDTEQENNQMTPDKSQVPQADQPMIELHNLDQR